jgi:hypothetical protein
MTKIKHPISQASGRPRPLAPSGEIDLPGQPTLAEGVAASVDLAESRSEQMVEAQAWLKEGGAFGCPRAAIPSGSSLSKTTA